MKTRNWTLTLALAGVIVIGGAVAADARPIPPWRPDPRPDARPSRSVLHIGLVGAYDCGDALVTVHNLETLQGQEWTFKQDDGAEDIQVRHVDGSWTSVGSVSGGESRRRWTGYGDVVEDLDGAVRLVRTDGTGMLSTVKLVGECPWG